MISDDLESACIDVIGVVLFSRAASSPLDSHLTLGDRPCIPSLGQWMLLYIKDLQDD